MNLQKDALLTAQHKLKSVSTVVRTVPTGTQTHNAENTSEKEPEFTEEQVKRIKEEHLSTNLDRWVKLIDPKYTIPTEQAPLTLGEAEALLHFSQIGNRFNKDTPSEKREEYMKNLEILEQKLEKLILAVKGHEIGCFVKLSCRSPKDVALQSNKTLEIYKDLIEKKKLNSPIDQNTKISTLYESSLLSMKVFNAKDALELLLQSKRISFDVELDLRFPADFSTHIIVRPWFDIPLHGEFRGFVCKKKFTALSQYYSHCFFPHLLQHQKEYENAILEFFKLQSHIFPLENYVIDFVVRDDYSVYILELNPFNESTGACLFSWELEEEKLQNGPFEFRIWKAPVVLERLKDQISPLFKTVLFDSK